MLLLLLVCIFGDKIMQTNMPPYYALFLYTLRKEHSELRNAER
jgi:hypothetical protein